jgi:malate/lactate dehydrogenase
MSNVRTPVPAALANYLLDLKRYQRKQITQRTAAAAYAMVQRRADVAGLAPASAIIVFARRGLLLI